MRTLTAVSLLAPNSLPAWRGIVDEVAARAGLRLTLLEHGTWRDWERMLYAGEVHVGFLCGVLYAFHTTQLRLVAAPVMAGERYGGRPVYFTDVVVRSDSPYRSFEDLRGTRWAYNGIESHSGYNVVAAHLAMRGQNLGYFGHSVESGAHQASLDMLRAGQVDAVPIDSTVLDTELEHDATLEREIRIISSLGPSPIPPVVSTVVSPYHDRLRDAFLSLVQDEAGRKVLAAASMARFVEVHDEDYHDVRRIAAEARKASLA